MNLKNSFEYQDHCDLCGKDQKGRFYGKGSNYIILKCSKCGLIWSDPLTTDRFEDLNEENYPAEEVYLKEGSFQKERFRSQLETLKSKIELKNITR